MKNRIGVTAQNAVKILLVGGGSLSLWTLERTCGAAENETQSQCPQKTSTASSAKYYALLRRVQAIGGQALTALPFSASTITQTEAAAVPLAGGVPVRSLLTTRSATQARTSPNASTAKTYDYVVIGYGNAGRAAVEKLRKECPGASIALIDPMQVPLSNKKMVYLKHRAVGLDPRERIVVLDDQEQSCVRFKHSVLIATGARGAPPPHYLIEDATRDKIVELRATVRSEPDQRPVLSPAAVERRVYQAAAAGKRVCVLGSGWEAVDLAVTATFRAPNKAAPTLIFGSSGPLSHVLPSYLSSAVSKRLKSRRIAVLDRTLIRYISQDDHDKEHSCLQIYVAKSFDFLDTNRSAAELLVIAPEVSGARGSAVLPTLHVPLYLEETRKQRAWYETWSRLTMATIESPSSVVCYKDDGRVAVNTEMVACTGVFAAGSAGKVANGLTGHADVAGFGAEDGVTSGRVAASNMARLYQASAILGFSGQSTQVQVKDPIPVWRSDLRSYPAKDRKSSLSKVGVTALCVGNCDSERFHTHGIWWTNQSAHRRMSKKLADDGTKKRQRRRKLKESLKPVYGLGFVYYIDRSGRIQGIMSWGLPFTTKGDKINEELLDEMKTILITNGGLKSMSSEIDHLRMANYLTIESRGMVATAFSGCSGDSDGQTHLLAGPMDNFPRPYHRFTEPRPPTVRSLGVMKRKGGQGHGVLGEDLFARYEDAGEETPLQPHGTGNVGYAAAKAEALYEWNVWEQKERQWDENESRARPPKEDPLWIRKGDEARNIAARETVAASYSAAIWNTRPYN